MGVCAWGIDTSRKLHEERKGKREKGKGKKDKGKRWAAQGRGWGI